MRFNRQRATSDQLMAFTLSDDPKQAAWIDLQPRNRHCESDNGAQDQNYPRLFANTKRSGRSCRGRLSAQACASVRQTLRLQPTIRMLRANCGLLNDVVCVAGLNQFFVDRTRFGQSNQADVWPSSFNPLDSLSSGAGQREQPGPLSTERERGQTPSRSPAPMRLVPRHETTLRPLPSEGAWPSCPWRPNRSAS